MPSFLMSVTLSPLLFHLVMVLSPLMSCIRSNQLSISCPRLTFLLFPKTRALSGMSLFLNLVFIFPKSTPSLRNVSLPSNLLPLTQNITTQRQAFATKMLPLIKKRSHDLFVKLAFPSMIEVTTTNGNALSTFGLTSTCPLARMVFDEFVFKAQASSSISPDQCSPPVMSMILPISVKTCG